MTRNYTILGDYTVRGLDKFIGVPNPEWAWQEPTGKRNDGICDCSGEVLMTAGYGSVDACCRIYVHTDGICIGAALSGLVEDEECAKVMYEKLLALRSSYAVRRS